MKVEYQASAERKIKERERELAVKVVALARARDGACAVWTRPGGPFARWAQKLETRIFGETFPDVMEPIDDQSRLMLLVDARRYIPRVVYGGRIASRRFVATESPVPEDSTGSAFLDSLIRLNPGLTLEEVLAYYQTRRVNVARTASVESMYRVGERIEFAGVSAGDLGRAVLMGAAVDIQSGGQGSEAVFAHLNSGSRGVLEMIGVVHCAPAGHEGLLTPTWDREQRCWVADPSYTPAELPSTERNLDVLHQALAGFKVPQVVAA